MRSAAVFAGMSSVALLVGSATAENATGTVTIPEMYRIGTPPAHAPHGATHPSHAANQLTTKGVEKSAAVEVQNGGADIDGDFWAEIFPIFNQGPAGNTSYFRLGAGSAASTFHVMIVGTPSGDDYGEGDISVPANASPQYAFSDLMSVTGVTGLETGDTAYTVYLTNPAQDSFYQHVIYNGTNNFFEDMTVCPTGASVEGSRTVTNVHSTILSGFPATVYLHNYLGVDATYMVYMRDSRTGLLLGTLPSLAADANSTYGIPESFFEQQMGVTPNSSQQHVTLEFHATAAFAQELGNGNDPTDVGGIFANTVYNAALGATVNLSNKCSVNR